jgi:thioredoxin 2
MRLAKVSTEEAPRLAAELGITSIPMIALFTGGREVARRTGAMPAAQIVSWTSGARANA